MWGGGAWARLVVLSRQLKVNFSNFHPIHHRTADGLLVSGRNSGTHWLKFMLSHAIASQHGLPPPERSSGPRSEDFICGPKQAQKYPWLPRIVTSHTICSGVVGWAWLRRLLRLPPVVVLVRDPIEAMLSFYVKWGRRYDVTLEEYAALKPSLGRPLADVWWYIAFMNCWGRLAAARSSNVLVVRYEDLQADPQYWLCRVSDHFGLGLGPEAIQAGLAVASRESVRRQEDAGFGEVIVPSEAERGAVRFSRAQREGLSTILAQNLGHDFGYGYIGKAPPMRSSRAALGLFLAALAYTLFSLFGRPELGIDLHAPWDQLELACEFSALTVFGALSIPRLGLAWAGYMAAAAGMVETAQISPIIPGDGRISEFLSESSGALLSPLLMLIAVQLVARLSAGRLRSGAQPTDRAWS